MLYAGMLFSTKRQTQMVHQRHHLMHTAKRSGFLLGVMMKMSHRTIVVSVTSFNFVYLSELDWLKATIEWKAFVEGFMDYN